MRNNFSFILSPLTLKTSFEIMDGCWMMQATLEQRRVIDATIAGFGNWEVSPLQDYVVINYTKQDTFEPPKEIELAFVLLRNSLHVGFTLFPDATGYMPSWSPGIMSRVGTVEYFFMDGCSTIEEKELNQISETCFLLTLIKTKAPEIANVIKFLADVRTIEPYSRYNVLAYVAIIEGLLTHNPKPQSKDASLTKQIASKMEFLSDKFERPLNYKVFQSDNIEAIWKRLYAYRSKVAHGSELDFQKELKILNDHITALAFLKEAAKLVCLYAIKNPRQIKDLKDY